VAEDLTEGHADEPAEGARALVQGWQPDPFGRFASRWWDGETWTASVLTSGGGVRWDAAPLDSERALVAPPAPGLRGVVVAFVGLGVGVGLAYLLGYAARSAGWHPAYATALLLSSGALWSGLLGAIVVVTRWRGTGSIVRDFGFRFRWSDLGYGFAGALVGRALATVAVLPIPLLDPDFRDRTDRTVFERASSNGASWVALVVVVCVGAPVIEELFFRGLVQNRLVERFGLGVGLPVASVLFGAAHLIGWIGVPTVIQAWAVTFGGLVLGATYHYSRRLGASIIAHSLFNAVAVLAIWATS
jgi:hypothetical protein